MVADGKLTALGIKRLKEPGYYGDGAGLYFRIEGGARYFTFRYTIAGRQRWMGLGPERDVTLAEARETARECRRLLRQGIDPIDQRKAERVRAKTATGGKAFMAVAHEYVASHRAGWRSAKHAAQWTATLEKYVFPALGAKGAEMIGTDDVLRVLAPIWQQKPETASRVRGRMEAVLDYAKTRGWRAGENPARWKGHLDHLLPARAKVARVVHHPALPWQDMPGVMARLAASESMSALALRFLILTATRSSETRGARWPEMDLEARTWTIPGERMKGAQPHRVPLSGPALTILRSVSPLRGEPGGLVFPGGRVGAPLSDVALSKALAAIRAGVTVHGCRSSFRDWASDATAFPREIAEQALAHALRDKTEAAYRRSDLFEKRALLMAEWGDFCTGQARRGVMEIPA